MTYLFSTFWVWFISSFILGALFGFFTYSRNESRYWPEKWSFSFKLLVGLFILGTVGAATLILPKRWGLGLEIFIIMLACYLIGCFLGAFFARCFFYPSKAQNTEVLLLESNGEAGEHNFSGQRPASIVREDHHDPVDDLKLILGIAEVNEARLNELGIYYFKQIAEWTPENIEWVGGYLAFPGRIEREDWVGQAKAFLAEQAKKKSSETPS